MILANQSMGYYVTEPGWAAGVWPARGFGQEGGFVQYKVVVAKAANRSRQIKAIQGGLKQTGMTEARRLRSTGALDRTTMAALNAYLKATQRPPMTPRDVLANLSKFAEELDVQRFEFDGPPPARHDYWCPMLMAEVIAADGRRYDNDCLARRAGAPPPYQRTSDPGTFRWQWFPSTFPLGIVVPEERWLALVLPGPITSPGPFFPHAPYAPAPYPRRWRRAWAPFYGAGEGGFLSPEVECSAEEGSTKCWLAEFPPPEQSRRGPIAGMQRAVDNFFRAATASSALGVTFKVEGENVVAGVPKAPLAQTGYDGVVDGMTAGWTGFAVAIAEDLMAPPPGADAGDGDERTIARNSDDIGFYLDNVAGRIDELVARYVRIRAAKKLAIAGAIGLAGAGAALLIYRAVKS